MSLTVTTARSLPLLCAEIQRDHIGLCDQGNAEMTSDSTYAEMTSDSTYFKDTLLHANCISSPFTILILDARLLPHSEHFHKRMMERPIEFRTIPGLLENKFL